MSYDPLHYLSDQQFIDEVLAIVPEKFHVRLEELANRPSAEEFEVLGYIQQRKDELEDEVNSLDTSLDEAYKRIRSLEDEISKLSEAESSV